jgi:hypothetical protein
VNYEYNNAKRIMSIGQIGQIPALLCPQADTTGPLRVTPDDLATTSDRDKLASRCRVELFVCLNVSLSLKLHD